MHAYLQGHMCAEDKAAQKNMLQTFALDVEYAYQVLL